ncbi:male development gene 1 [Plasmodium gonderi]|uniref:Male development gene 1 n=1 Tax=Plasmodium gonderi TaxID=77519 RepID=A0A1Y1JQL8_PLAGO|nr:male development gene 1 [Plasmodium gonderi]GAW83547.1 male development gene 1 [Plasmodium gonderi]
MKNLKFSILNISCLLIFYLSSQNVYYDCINTGKTLKNVHHNNTKPNVKDNSLSTEWSEKGYNFMDLVKNGYLKNKGDLDNVKDYLADELAKKIQNKLGDYLKDEKNLYDLENMDDEDVNDFKNYAKDISQYIGLKAADILDTNLGEALKPFLSKNSYTNFEKALDNKQSINLEFDEQQSYDEDVTDENTKDGDSNDIEVNDETEEFINELVDEYEDKHHKELEENAQEIKTHNNLD